MAGCFLRAGYTFHVPIRFLHLRRKGNYSPERKPISWVCSYRLRPGSQFFLTLTRTQSRSTTLRLYFSFKSTAWYISMALLQNVLPHQFISEKVKIVEAVYFANTLNQSCSEFFRHQKACYLMSRILSQHWCSFGVQNSAQHIYSPVHSFNKY